MNPIFEDSKLTQLNSEAVNLESKMKFRSQYKKETFFQGRK
jgi:hypothetical protein